MKNMILVLLFLGAASLVFSQERMPINNDLNNRTAAKDMNNTLTPPALPVLNTYVAPEVISKTTGSYAKGLYSITQVKTAMGENAYQVTLMDNGQPKYEWVNESGTAVANVFRTPETDSMNALTNNMGTNSNMNSNNNTMNNAGSTTVNSNVTTTQNTMDSTATNTQINTTTNNANAMDSSMNNSAKNNWNNNMNNAKASNNDSSGKVKMNKTKKQDEKKINDKGTMNDPSNNNEKKMAKPVKNSPAKPKEGK